MDKDFITKRVFFWIMGIAITINMAICGYTIGRLDKVTEIFNHNFTQVASDISAINAKMDIVLNKLEL